MFFRRSRIGFPHFLLENEEPKNPDTCNLFSIYKLVATTSQQEDMRKNYLGGNYGYGHAKLELFELILTKFETERAKYDELMADKSLLDEALAKGAEKARVIANEVLGKVRSKMGF